MREVVATLIQYTVVNIQYKSAKITYFNVKRLVVWLIISKFSKTKSKPNWEFCKFKKREQLLKYFTILVCCC